MKKLKRISAAGQVTRPKTHLRVLCKALMAVGLVSALPTFAGPLPTACTGTCGSSGNLSFVQAGSASATTSGSVMTINQNSPTAILNWQNFNIAHGNTVNFIQPSSTASALNRIWDANPTTIAGSLNANGQIYLINQNGIIFANGAQVNTGALIASSLNISDAQYQAGYLTNVSGTPDFTSFVPSAPSGFVRVDSGAQLNGSRIMLFAPVVENNGSINTQDGQVALAAGTKVYLEASQDPNLRGVLIEVDLTKTQLDANGNTIVQLDATGKPIKDANGNTIPIWVSAAGQADPNLAATSSHPAYVQNNAAGTVTNSGSVLSQRGNITLVGYAVNQQGLLSATTAVNENGTIKLEARYNVAAVENPSLEKFLPPGVSTAYDIRATQTGTVTMTSGSAITVVPETASTATVTGGQGFNPSIVEVTGKIIDMQSGSSIVAPFGQVTLAAMSSIDTSAPLSGTGNNVYQLINLLTNPDGTTNTDYNKLSGFLNPNYLPSPNPAGDNARVFLDSGSTIDVSGSTATVSVARDILAVQLRGAELADSPLQKTSPFYGQTVYVDIRQGTTLANYAGEEAQILRGVAELTSNGGSVKLLSTGNVVTKTGSNINISGGQIDYTGAYVNTSNLISNGVVYNIANASPNIVYQGIAGSYAVTSAKWGVTQTFNTMAGGDTRGRWDSGYVQGQSAGTLTVLAPDAVINGNVIANTVAGLYQTQPYFNPSSLAVDNYKNTWQMMPQGGSLVVGNSNAPAPDNNTILAYNYITNAGVVFQANPLSSGFGLNDTLPAAFQQTIYLDPASLLSANGVNQLGVYTNSTVTVNAGTSLSFAPGGSLTLQGDTVNMAGSIFAPSGTVNLGSAKTNLSGQLPGGISVGSAVSASTISTRGAWVNDSPLTGITTLANPVFINGGNVAINSGGNLSVAAGTTIDASGGALVDNLNKVHGGNGGSISIAGNYNQSVNPYQGQLDNLNLQSYGVAGGKGGALSISAGDIVIGGTGLNALDLPVGFFNSGGFTSYTLNSVGGLNGLLLAPGSEIAPLNQTLILNNTALKAANGTDVYSFTQADVLQDWQRTPVSISLKQSGGGAGSLKIGAGSSIKVDPGSSISLTSDSQLTVLGTLDAPAGNINLTLNSAAPKSGFNNGNSTLWLGSQSQLLAQGAAVITPNSLGLQQGQVLSGGNINLKSNMFVLAQQGSLLDVSGTSANLDLPQLVNGSAVYRNSQVAGNAGKISITATEGILLDGSMKAGVASGSTAANGSFNLTLAGMQASDRTASTFPADFPKNPLWEVLVQSSGAGSFVTRAGLQPGNDSVAGSANLTAVDGMAYVDASVLQNAGFDKVSLTSSYGPIVLADKLSLTASSSITLDAPVIALSGNSASVSSAYVNLANSNINNQSVPAPVAGTGTLTVSGQLVDLTGNISLSGINQLTINSTGDIRLNGVLNTTTETLLGSLQTQGNVTLQANQVYPTTMSQFSIHSSNDVNASVAVNTPVTASVTGGNIVTVADTSKLAVGDVVSGDGFPAGTIIKTITNGTTFVTSLADNNTTATGAALHIASGKVVTVADTSNLAVGDSVSGYGFPDGTIIASITNSTTFVTSETTLTPADAKVNAAGVIPSLALQISLPANKIQILPNATDAAIQSIPPVLSAGGQVTLNAATIDQNGVLKAPMGSISLSGSQSVTLGSGSLTSVSADGQIIPFGTILGGTGWLYNLVGATNIAANSNGNVNMTAPPQKQINIQGSSISMQNGAVVNLSGGGDLYANEFIPGTGGTLNVLNPTQGPANTYAIIPGMSTFAPYDPQLSGQYLNSATKSPLSVGSSVYLSGGSGLSAGYYALLPASYALLPGAYTVTMVSGHKDMLPGQGTIQLVGSGVIMAGKLAVAGTNMLDARWSGFDVAPGSLARTQSQFLDSYASSYFTTQAASNSTAVPLLPADAGQLVVTANSSAATLSLNGTFLSLPGTGGLGAQVDFNVVGSGFDIVNKSAVNGSTTTSGLVQLDTNALNKMGVQSLLIGGVRSQSASGTAISVGADQVVVENAGSSLSGPEIILAANDAVTVKAGSSIQASGTFSGQAGNFTIGNNLVTSSVTNPITSVVTTTTTLAVPGDGALLRVSSGPQVVVGRNNLSGTAPAMTVESGAVVNGASVLLDSSSATNIGSGALLSGNSFGVAAQNIAIGNTTATPASTLLLTGTLLSQLSNFGSLALHSYSDIDFFGAASIGGLDAKNNHLIGNLTLNATSINGLNNSGMNDVIDAGVITLINNNGSVTTPAQYSAGSLNINAGNIVMAGGNISIQGFNAVTLNASGMIQGEGTGGLTVNSGDTSAHTLQVNAGQITGTAGSNQTISAANYDIRLGLNSGSTLAAVYSPGASFTVFGKSIADAGIINMPTGTVALNATGAGSGDGVTLSSGAKIIATGVSKTLAGQTVYAPAGAVNLGSANGGITLSGGSLIDVSANAGGGNAGNLNLSAPNGPVTMAGDLKGSATANFTQGSFTLDAHSLSLNAGSVTGNALTDLNNTLNSGSFTSLRDIRVRTGNLSLDAGTVVLAQSFMLTADAGTIDVAGTINASGSSGGSIMLAAGAGNNITLKSSSLLDAHATGSATGGNVTLETTVVGSTVGSINMMNSNPTVGSQINVAGSGGTGGTVLLRAPQINGNDVAVNYQSPGARMAGTGFSISSGAKVTVEAFQSVSAPSGGVLLPASSYQGAINTFMTNAAANSNLMTGLLGATATSNAHPNISLVPGLEIDSSGNLTLGSLLSTTTGVGNQANAWGLSGWRYNDGNGHNVPVILTLRAAGNLNIDSSLSDGFQSATSSLLATNTGPSSSYRLVAGADMTSANVMAVNNTVSASSGNVALAAGSETTPTSSNKIVTATMEAVRTGTGFIDVAAGGSVNLANRDAVIYTAGQASQSAPSYNYNSQASIFPVGGGDISIYANGNINGDSSGLKPVNQLVSEWQWRQGQSASNGTYLAPAWWINYGAFRQNIGALGGGNVDINAGGNINTLSAVVPTSGYVDSSGNTVVLGGGNLSVTAGGSINSGIFYVGNGQGTIQAGSGLGVSRYDTSNKAIYTILLLGQGGFNVQTQGDINLQTVLNPTVLGSSFSQKPSNISYFYTYDGSGNISLSSLDGNIQLVNSINFSSNANQASTTPFFMNSPMVTNVYPASLELTAFNGGITNNANPLVLFPSSTGNLQLFANTDINLGGGIGMSDMSPSALLPVNSAGTNGQTSRAPAVSVTTHGTVIDPATLLPVPVHANDPVPITIVAGGDVKTYSISNQANLELPKQTLVNAGQDILNVTADIQNQHSTDATSFVAGRDINFISLSTAGITVSGPGQVILQAGRNVNLGISNGVVTEGNLNNPALPSQGADITILAGAGQSGADTKDFINKFIDPAKSTTYNADLIAFVCSYGAPQSLCATPVSFGGVGAGISATHKSVSSTNGGNVNINVGSPGSGTVVTPSVSATQAFAYFNSMSKSLQGSFVNQVLFDELRTSGRSAIATKDYSAGYAAISTLFPNGGGYSGDLTMYNSQIKTESGGNINILTPGGGVDAGLASANTGKPASQIGVVTVGGGNINAFVNNDFTVNQSRVFTIQGGNILMWSSNGSLDAGSGSKTASSTPPPLLVVNLKTGEFSVDATASIVGSGIGVLLGNKNVVPGSIDLYAPTGVINAGDAGITTAGNIYLGATQVIGANNISFGGTGAGVPVTTVAPVSVSGMGNMQDASKAADQATQNLSNASDLAKMQEALANFKPTFISVDVIGLGDESMGLQQ